MTAHSTHVHSIRVYLAVWGTLMLLTALTVAVSYVHLGALNVPIALFIASVKAALVALFFMHLFYDEKFNLVVFGCGVVFAVIFLAFTLGDPLTRGEIYYNERNEINPAITRLTTASVQTAPQKPPTPEAGNAAATDAAGHTGNH